jgi:hypothetical protein
MPGAWACQRPAPPSGPGHGLPDPGRRAHPDYGDRRKASQVAASLAPRAGLQAGTARTYPYAELDGGKS